MPCLPLQVVDFAAEFCNLWRQRGVLFIGVVQPVLSVVQALVQPGFVPVQLQKLALLLIHFGLPAFHYLQLSTISCITTEAVTVEADVTSDDMPR